MKISKIIVVLITLFFSIYTKAQVIEQHWSEKLIYDNKETGYFSSYVDVNDQYVYATFTNNPMSGELKKQMLVAYDKLTMKKISKAGIFGCPDNELTKKEFSDLDYYKTIILDDAVFIFWTKVNKETEELYVEKLDPRLNRVKKLERISVNTLPDDIKRSILGRKAVSFLVLGHGKHLILGIETPSKTNNSKLKYASYNSNLISEKEHLVTLPVKLENNYLGLGSGYELSEDGNLIISSAPTADPSKDNSEMFGINAFAIGTANRIIIISYLKCSTGQMSSVIMAAPEKEITNIKYHSTDVGLSIFALYYDLKTDPKKEKIRGWVKAKINKNTLEKEDVNCLEFDSKTLEKLYAKNNLEKTMSTKDVIDLYLEDAVPTNNSSTILIFSKHSYSTISSSSMLTEEHSGEIVALKINDDEEISWTTTIDRMYYSYLQYRTDIQIVTSPEKIQLFFGSEDTPITPMVITKEKLSGAKNQFGYVALDCNSGVKEQKQIYCNESKESKEKMVNLHSSIVLGDRLYTVFSDVMHDNNCEGFISSCGIH